MILTAAPVHWVHDLSPFLIQFSDTLGVRYYGLAYVLGFLGALGLMHFYRRGGLTPLATEKLGDLLIALVIGVMVGGRLGYFLLYDFGSVKANPWVLVQVWNGGMASHGGFVGVALALGWFARRERVSFLHLGDLVTSVAPLGLCLGRVANFINGELWGKVSEVKWAVVFPASAPVGTPVELIAARHPSQLYAAGLEGLLLLGLMQVLVWRTRWMVAKPGMIAGVFLAAYAVARAVGEIYREPDAALILGLSRGTFYSIFLGLAGVAVMWWGWRRSVSEGVGRRA